MGDDHSRAFGCCAGRWSCLPLIAVLFPLAAWAWMVMVTPAPRVECACASAGTCDASEPGVRERPGRVPAIGHRGWPLVGLPPTPVGLHVKLPPADYRYVPLFRDDISDVRTACLLRAILDGRLGEPISDEPEACGPDAAEFAIYLAGRSLSESGNPSGARAAWRSLLAMPPADRPWRSTWAAFMIGKSYVYEAPAEAIVWFRRTRELAAQGFADSLGLANSSIGWEALAELELGNHPRSLRLYLEHKAAGDPTADGSLDAVSRAALGAPMVRLAQYARDPVMRPVISRHAEELIDLYPREYATSRRDRWRDAMAIADSTPAPR